MKKCILVAFLFCLTSTIVNAQTFKINRPAICDALEKMMSVLTEAGEKPIWQGTNVDTKIRNVLTLNASTGAWSLIITDGKVACMTDMGEGFSIVDKIGQPDSKIPQVFL